MNLGIRRRTIGVGTPHGETVLNIVGLPPKECVGPASYGAATRADLREVRDIPKPVARKSRPRSTYVRYIARVLVPCCFRATRQAEVRVRKVLIAVASLAVVLGAVGVAPQSQAAVTSRATGLTATVIVGYTN